jgi:YidC/Oxa1 family membrane protein insertase
MEIPGWGQFVGLIEWVLVQLATFTGGSGLAIITLTILIKLALVPLTLASLRSAKRMQELQPKIKELQKQYGDDRQMLSAETMKLYQENRVNPFGSCLPILLQMPIFFALYYAIFNISSDPKYADAGFSTSFLWIPNLALHDHLYILPFVVTITQFIQQRMAMPQKVPGQVLDDQQRIMNQMMQIMPLMVGFFAWQFAAGPVIYWITQNIFSAVQQFFITGFGSLRDLPGMGFLPVPPWVTPPPTSGGSSDSKVIVTKSRPSTPSRPAGAAKESAPAPGGLMGRLYGQINRRIEQIEHERQGPAAADTGSMASSGGATGSRETPPPAGPTGSRSGDGLPARRSSRRSRSRR